MSRLVRLWQVLGYLFFCFYETVESYFTPVGAFVLSIFFFPFRRLLFHPPPKRLRVALEELGGAYVKIGQLLSTRVDILPSDYVKELEYLQDRVPPQPLEELLEFYPQLQTAFSSIEEEPIGSGSIAQVHRAVLNDGREVAVKIIRPKAEGLIKRDVSLLKGIIFLLSFVPVIRDFRIPQVLSEFERMLFNELDLATEAAYLELFRKFSEEEQSLYVPEVVWEFTSSRYLTTEFIRGRKLSSEVFEGMSDERRRKLAEKFVHIVNRMVFELGVFHGDLHPGNIFYLEDGKFAFVDFGIVGRLSPDTLSEFFLFSWGVMNKDPDVIVDSLKRIGAINREVNENLLKREILIFLDKYYNRPLSQIDAEKLFYDELTAARRFKVVLPEELVILMKTIAHTESIARIISPDFRLPPLLKPYLLKIFPRVTFSTIRRKLFKFVLDYGELLEKIPDRLKTDEEEKSLSSGSFFWGSALLGFSVVAVFSPKLLVLYLPALYFFKRAAEK